MQAHAEGFDLMRHNEKFHLDLAQVACIWQHGSGDLARLAERGLRGVTSNPTIFEKADANWPNLRAELATSATDE